MCSWQRQWAISVYGVKICEQVLTTDEYAALIHRSLFQAVLSQSCRDHWTVCLAMLLSVHHTRHLC